MDISEAKIELIKQATALTAAGNMILPRLDFIRHYSLLAKAAGIPIDRQELEAETWPEAIACEYM